MKLPFSKGASYYVVGMGRSGQSATSSLLKSGASVYVWDDRNFSEWTSALPERAIPSSPDQIPWPSISSLILSPGIPHTFPRPHAAAEAARCHQVPILCDVDLFFQAGPVGPVIGVTGTNGKSTTVSLIVHCLKTAGLEACAAGNIGYPILELKNENLSDHSFITVLELSSYQLERTPHLSLDIGVHLNLTPDHLDRHGSMEGYCQAKKHLVQKAKISFVGVDDDYSRSIYEDLVVPSGSVEKKQTLSAQGPVDEGIFFEKDSFFQALYPGGNSYRSLLFRDKDLPVSLHGSHNRQNILAAYGVCSYLGVSLEAFKKGLKSFKGLPHRQEIIRQEEAVTFVNDSKATNLISTLQALKSFESIFWIAGGQSKDDDLSLLYPLLSKIKKAYLIGEAEEVFAKALEGRCLFDRCGQLDTALKVAYHDAKKEKKAVILLSPACASFDQYKNFEERGEVFRKLVLSLASRSLKEPTKRVAP